MIRQHGWVFIAAVMWIVSGPRIDTARANEVQVNTYTTGTQGGASVAMDADGDLVVVWESYGSGGTDSSAGSIQGQRYASDGSAVGGQFQVNTYTTGPQYSPSVGLDADGDFVVVWEGFGVRGQRYASDGSTVGSEFEVGTLSFGGEPSVGLDADGDFVAVWTSNDSVGTDTDGLSIQGQRYASDGSSVGGQFQVNTYTTDTQYKPSVALDAGGDFVVVWGFSDGLTESSIQGQRYASDGSTVGGEFQVNTYTTFIQIYPSVGLDADGDFVVVWQSGGSVGTDADGGSVQGQRYASGGSSVGGQFQVNTYTTDNQRSPSVALDADGDFVVVWRSDGSDGTDSSSFSIQGQRYASGGSSVGGEFQVNTYTTAAQSHPSVALDADGDFVAVWQSDGSGGTDSDGFSIQRTPAALIFADGFESGDIAAWTVTQP